MTKTIQQAVKEIVFSYFSDIFLKAMEDDWNSCDVIFAERKPILSEGLIFFLLVKWKNI